MAVAEIHPGTTAHFAGAARTRIPLFALFSVLALYTLSTLDGGEIPVRIISAVLLLFTAGFVALRRRHQVVLGLPTICLLLMAAYGVVQTLWFPQKIVYNGWTGTLFWFTAAIITLLSTQLFQNPLSAARFRSLLVAFGGAVCALELLERASATNRYYWLIPSRYPAVYGPFAYWNNFAEFVELVLPVTLWMGLGGRKPAVSYLLLSALEIGAVISSGSRAGTGLVIAEFLAVVGIACVRKRSRKLAYAAGAAVLLSGLFVWAAGFDTVVAKLEKRDQLAVRRALNASSLAMIRERPFTGWGLGTYVPVYPMFATYDDGSWVNHAHNDWLEWTAEGGIFFSGLMLVLFVWSIRPALRSGWGIGVLAICLHALVDYPFARLGVCAWYFAMIGMLNAQIEWSSASPRWPPKLRKERLFWARRTNTGTEPRPQGAAFQVSGGRRSK